MALYSTHRQTSSCTIFPFVLRRPFLPCRTPTGMAFPLQSLAVRLIQAALTGICLIVLAACSSHILLPPACMEDQRDLKVAFYAFFPPVSYSASTDPASAAFHLHQGYEADLLTALEAMQGTGLSFDRTPIASWEGIWLLPATPQYDLAGGGITILDTRTRNAAGTPVIAFTTGHLTFRQSLLVRAQDARKFAAYDQLTSDVRVGVIAGTTGEARLLQLTGLADAQGILVAGVRIETPQGMAVTDGSAAYYIAAAGASPLLEGRRHLYPPADTMPQILYLGYETGDHEIQEALRTGHIDAIARGEIGNQDLASVSDHTLAISVLDDEAEYGGFALSRADAALAACLSDRIDWLTAQRRIGYGAWRDDPAIFLRRAQMWNAMHAILQPPG